MEQWIIRLRKHPWMLMMALLILTSMVYWPVRHFEFLNYDDDQYVTNNPEVKAGFTPENLRWVFIESYKVNYWHPLTLLSHMLDVKLFGMNAGGHHVTNVILHLVNVVLIFAVLRSMTGSVYRSLLVAAFFALHPLNVQSVAWVAERKNVLSTIFWWLTIWAYWYYTLHRNWIRYVLVVLSLVLGLMSKPMLVTLPCVLILLDFWPLKRIALSGFEWKKAWGLFLEKIPLFLLVLGVIPLTMKGQQHLNTVYSLDAIPMSVRVANAVVSYATYLFKMIWPMQLAVFYPHPGSALSIQQIVLSTVFLVLMTLFVIWKGRLSAVWPVGWFWYLGTLVPVIGIVQVGAQAMADRYVYVPLAGIFILASWGIAELMPKDRFPTALKAAVAIALIILISAATVQQLKPWKDSLSLFTRAIQVTRKNYLAHNNIGSVYHLRGDLDRALQHYQKSVDYNSTNVDSLYNLGTVLLQRNAHHEAIPYFIKAIRLNPRYVQAYNNLGAAYIQLGRFDEAISVLQKALEIQPDFKDARNNLDTAIKWSQKK